MADVNISVAAQIREFRKELEQIPGITAKQARGMSRAFAKEARKVERAAKRTAQKSKDLADGFEGLKNAAEGVGGEIGGVAGQIEKAFQATTRLGGAMGKYGPASVAFAAGMTAGGFAVSAMVAGMVGLVGAADEAIDSLGVVAQVLPDETVQRVQEAGDAMERFEMASSAASVVLASEFAPAVGESADLMVRLYSAAQDNGYTFDWLFGKLEDAARNTMPNLYAGLKGVSLALQAAASSADDVTGSLAEMIEVQQEWAKHEKDVAEVMREVEAERRKASAAARTAAAEAAKMRRESLAEQTKALREAEAAEASLARIIREAASDSLTDAEKAQQAYQDRNQAILEAAEASGNLLAANEALAASEQRLARDLASIDKEAAEAAHKQAESLRTLREEVDSLQVTIHDFAPHIMDSLDVIGGAMADTVTSFASTQIAELERSAEAQVAAADKATHAWARQERQRIEGLVAAGKMSEKVAARQLEAIDEEERRKLRKNKRLARDEQRAAKRAHKAQQAAAMAMVPVEVARTTAALTPYFWFAGPGAPAAAFGVAAAMGGAQIAAIQSASPPSFPTGGRVGDRYGGDHVPIMATREEGIVTEAGMSRIGGSQGLDAINRGSPLGGDVTVILPDGAVSRSTRRHLMGSAGSRTIAAQTGLPVGQAWVYGGR